MKMMKANLLVLLIGCISSLTISGTSYARDTKEYPGSMCQTYFGNQSALLYKYGTVKSYNYSSSPLWVTCPVVKDNFTGTNGIQYAEMKVKLHSTANNPFYCKFINADYYTGSEYASDSGSVSTYYAGSYDYITLSINRSTKGSYAFLCRVPRHSEIVSYRVVEYDSAE